MGSSLRQPDQSVPIGGFLQQQVPPISPPCATPSQILTGEMESEVIVLSSSDEDEVSYSTGGLLLCVTTH